MEILPLILVFLGSACGGACRWFLAGWIDVRTARPFPFGTLAVNVTGALGIGVVWGLWTDAEGGRLLALFLLPGFFGGYTTVSGFSLQTLDLWLLGHRWQAGANAALSYFLCLAGVFAGLGMAAWMGGV